ncbi:hypothetical protein M9H77_07306 [Catharanthus roseus]|uniref:Uncharacterized protein n=1 Tax=Catharanthus roseus TaxID=4058 RepID=A0ACC0BUN4_CATRO|nr:hypothetical protein M9H77_07306 [Catharanthus roseus]
MGIFRIEELVYQDLVRKFYFSRENMSQEGFTVTLNRKKFKIDLECLSQALAITNEGARTVEKKDIKSAKGYEEAKFKREAVVNLDSVNNSESKKGVLRLVPKKIMKINVKKSIKDPRAVRLIQKLFRKWKLRSIRLILPRRTNSTLKRIARKPKSSARKKKVPSPDISGTQFEDDANTGDDVVPISPPFKDLEPTT